MITINNLLKKYENGNVAINDVSLKIADVGLVALVGASGAGKTTLLNLLAMNDKPTGGHIDCDGIEYNEANRKVLSQQFAYIYQDYKLIENISAYNNLKIAMELSGRAESQEEIIKVLQRVGIEEYADELVMNLSGGQKQRVAIARALIRNPKILFADEPTGNLDSENTNNIFALLKELSEKMSVILVTHDTTTVADYASRIIELKDGKVISDNGDTIGDDGDKIQSNKDGGLLQKSSTRPKLSTGSVLLLAKSLNNAKKGRRIAFSIIIIVMISILLLLASWSLLTYNKSVMGTFNARANVRGVMINLDINSEISGDVDGEGFSGTNNHPADMTNVAKFIENDIGGKVARVIPADTVQIRNKFYNETLTQDVNGKPISVAHFYANRPAQNIVLSDNLEQIGIDIIKGTAPKNLNEVAISDGMYEYIEAIGGIRNPDANASKEDKLIKLRAEDIIGYEVYGVKIVGVFDDKLEIDEKYYNYSAVKGDSGNLIDLGEKYDDETQYIREIVSSNILSNCIIASTKSETYYNDVARLNKGDMSIQVKLTSGENASIIDIMPANPGTEYWTKTDNLAKDEILIPNFTAFSMGIKEGDIVEVRSDWMIQAPLAEEYRIIENIAKKSYRARISNQPIDYAVVNDAEYDILTDNYELINQKIFFYKNNMSLNDLNKISDFVDKNYKDWDGNSQSKTSDNLIFESDFGGEVSGKFETMHALKTMIYIVLAIIVVAYLLLSFNTAGVIVTSKANELLILKSLGATKRQFIGVYGIISAVQTLIELIAGGLMGALLIYAFNSIIGAVSNTWVIMLPFDFITLGIMIGVVIAVNALSLIINIAKMNTKNLRKAFQSTHR